MHIGRFFNIAALKWEMRQKSTFKMAPVRFPRSDKALSREKQKKNIAAEAGIELKISESVDTYAHIQPRHPIVDKWKPRRLVFQSSRQGLFRRDGETPGKGVSDQPGRYLLARRVPRGTVDIRIPYLACNRKPGRYGLTRAEWKYITPRGMLAYSVYKTLLPLGNIPLSCLWSPRQWRLW